MQMYILYFVENKMTIVNGNQNLNPLSAGFKTTLKMKLKTQACPTYVNLLQQLRRTRRPVKGINAFVIHEMPTHWSHKAGHCPGPGGNQSPQHQHKTWQDWGNWWLWHGGLYNSASICLARSVNYCQISHPGCIMRTVVLPNLSCLTHWLRVNLLSYM